jgi:excisionase family DNA binding protein
MSGSGLLTPGDVAERLKVKPRTVHEWLRIGRLGGLKIGGLWRVRESDLDAFLALAASSRLSAPPPSSSSLSTEERAARVDAVVGKYAHLPGGVDHFLKQKHEETAREEERWQQRHREREVGNP